MNHRKQKEFRSFCASVSVCYEVLLDIVESSMDIVDSSMNNVESPIAGSDGSSTYSGSVRESTPTEGDSRGSSTVNHGDSLDGLIARRGRDMGGVGGTEERAREEDAWGQENGTPSPAISTLSSTITSANAFDCTAHLDDTNDTAHIVSSSGIIKSAEKSPSSGSGSAGGVVVDGIRGQESGEKVKRTVESENVNEKEVNVGDIGEVVNGEWLREATVEGGSVQEAEGGVVNQKGGAGQSDGTEGMEEGEDEDLEGQGSLVLSVSVPPLVGFIRHPVPTRATRTDPRHAPNRGEGGGGDEGEGTGEGRSEGEGRGEGRGEGEGDRGGEGRGEGEGGDEWGQDECTAFGSSSPSPITPDTSTIGLQSP